MHHFCLPFLAAYLYLEGGYRIVELRAQRLAEANEASWPIAAEEEGRSHEYGSR